MCDKKCTCKPSTNPPVLVAVLMPSGAMILPAAIRILRDRGDHNVVVQDSKVCMVGGTLEYWASTPDATPIYKGDEYEMKVRF